MTVRSKPAFTLIELLVVIAIIAILAAILFPVFAQAREKARSVSCLSNQKQIALGILMYTQDYDETFPQGWGYDAPDGLGWLTNYFADVPADWEVAADSFPGFQQAQFTMWANSILPYTKNNDILACPSSAEYRNAAFLFGDYSAANTKKAFADVSYSFNGLLSGSTLASVNTPGGLILLGEWYGKVKIAGAAITVPTMHCDHPSAPCIYKADDCSHFDPVNGCACATGSGTLPDNGSLSGFLGLGDPNHPVTTPQGTEPSATIASERIHTNGVNTAFADGHVKYRHVGGQNVPNPTDGNVDPFVYYFPDGIADVYWSDGCHPSLFKPDGNYQ